MAQDEGKETFHAAALTHALMKSWETMNATTAQVTLEASKKNHGEIDVDKLVESCSRMEALIETERLHRTKRLETLTELKTDLNKAVDKLESLVEYGKESREEWLKAGMPLARPLRVTIKPIKFDKGR